MYKRNYKTCLAMPLLFISFAFVIDEKAGKALNKIQKYYDQHSAKKFIYLKYTTATINKEGKGEALPTEMWMDQEKLKLKYENPFMLLYQDNQCMVSVMKEDKLIIINNSENKNTLEQVAPASAFSADSLKKYASGITCVETGGKGILTLHYPEKFNKQANPLRNVVLEYTSKGELKKASYEYEKSGDKEATVIEYLQAKYTFDKNILSATALATVFDGNKLKPVYKNYTVRDLRNKQMSK